MLRFILLSSLFLSSLFSDQLVYEKIENIVGYKSYQENKALIELLFKNEQKYIVNGKLRYFNIFSELKRNGLLDFEYNKSKLRTIKFKIINKPLKGYYILNSILKSLGYDFILTKKFSKLSKDDAIWEINYDSDFMLDPVIFLNELQQKNCKIANVENRSLYSWNYEIDFNDAILLDAVKIEKNEKVKFQKPLKDYILMVDDLQRLQILSRKLNNWFPYIVFYDNDLNILGQIKKNRVYKGITLRVPKGTKYIKITDLYNLINIKRGLSIIVK